MATRVFVGNLNRRATERDVEKFFRGFGKIQDVILKTGFGFVDFADTRDAEDAVYEMNGKDLCGDRVTVEMSRPRGEGGRGRGRGGFEDRGGYRGGRGDYNGGGGRDFNRGDDSNGRRTGKAPNLTEFRVTVENLSSRVSWQDLKDLMAKAGEVTFADAHKRNDNSGIVCFATVKDMKRAIEKYDGYELNGRKLKMVQEYKERNERNASRSRSRSRSDRSRSKGSDKRSRSRSGSASSHEASRSSKSKSASPPPTDD